MNTCLTFSFETSFEDIDYYHRTDIVDAVFKEFLKKIYRDFYAKMSKKYGVPPATLKRWYEKLRSNPSWRPYDTANHGMQNRYFTDEEEHSIAEFIRETFTNQGLLFTTAHFRVLSM